jgi:hypothetical protein
MSDYLADAAARTLAIAQEALHTVTGGKVDAGYWPYQQDAFPYLTVRHAAMTVNPTKYAEDIESEPEQLLLRLVVGHFTEGYAGETQAKAFSYYSAIRDYFRARKTFTTAGTTYGDYTDEPDYLEPDTEDWISAHTGLVIFSNSGVLTPQLAYEFTLNIPYLQSVY